jgi:exodeoxyribonuclease VII small subunit
VSKNPKPVSKPGDDPGSLSFEEALEQVEAIIDRIERGEIGLEDSLAQYERGVRLVQHCRQIHKHAVQRVDELTQRLLSGGGEAGGAGGAGAEETEEQDAPPAADDDSEH